MLFLLYFYDVITSPSVPTIQYRFQHEDLVRKRTKILQQKREMEDATKYRDEVALNTRRMLSEQRNKLYRQGKQDQESIKREILSRLSTVHARGRGTNRKGHVWDALDILKRELDEQEKRFVTRLRLELSTHDLRYYEQIFPKIVGSKVDIVRSENKILDEEIQRLQTSFFESPRYQAMLKKMWTHRQKPLDGKGRPKDHATKPLLRKKDVATGRSRYVGNKQGTDSSMGNSAMKSMTSSQIRTQINAPYERNHFGSSRLGDVCTDQRSAHLPQHDVAMDDFRTKDIVKHSTGVKENKIASK